MAGRDRPVRADTELIDLGSRNELFDVDSPLALNRDRFKLRRIGSSWLTMAARRARV
jgi:hypothetical protein